MNTTRVGNEFSMAKNKKFKVVYQFYVEGEKWVSAKTWAEAIRKTRDQVVAKSDFARDGAYVVYEKIKRDTPCGSFKFKEEKEEQLKDIDFTRNHKVKWTNNQLRRKNEEL